MDMCEVINVIANNPRSRWIELLSDGLNIDPNNPHVLIGEDAMEYNLDFKSLNEGWTYTYLKVGDFIKDSNGITYYVSGLPMLDQSFNSQIEEDQRSYAMRVIDKGNTVSLMNTYLDNDNNLCICETEKYIEPGNPEYTIINKSEVPKELLDLVDKAYKGEVIVH